MRLLLTSCLTSSRRSPPLSPNIFLWPYAVLRADYRDIKHTNGLDAYFFVRFLRMMARVLFPTWLVSWLVLLPVTSVGTSAGQSDGLTQFNFGNIGPNQSARYAAHLILVWIFTVWLWWNIDYEMSHFVSVRQRWLMDPVNASSAQANTILVTGVPQRYLTEAALKNVFAYLPGGVRKVWLNRDLKEMPDLYDHRVAACKKLESAETDLVNTAVKLYNKELKKEAKKANKQAKRAGKSNRQDFTYNAAEDPWHQSDPSIADTDDIMLTEEFVPRDKRPTHRLPLFSWMPFSLPLMGKKVDSIEWARQEIAETNAALRESRRTLARDVARASTIPAADEDRQAGNKLKPDKDGPQTYPPLNSAFVLFDQQIAAHLAAQTLTHHGPYRMARKSINVAPADVIWGNLNMNPYEARVRTAIGWCATIGLIILWAFPVAFVGAVSNIHSLCLTYGWLRWICNLPSVIVGIISGILPPALLAVLMMLLPIVLRLLARFEGMPQRTAIELSLMDRFFLFQVIHSFLIVSLSSGIIAALPSLLNDPGSIPTLLANNLPKASTFFLTYIILQGLSGTASGFLQVVPLVLYYVKLFILGSTPRSIYKIKYTLRSVQWGTTFPTITLLVVITVAYSIISPIINGLAFATFFLFYQMWKYLFLWQLDQPRSSETGGRFFPKAIQHVFVGMYLQQICLAALFFLAQNDAHHPSAVPEGALMVVLIAFTAFFNMIINNSYGPLIEYLPLTLADKMQAVNDANRDAAEQHLNDSASVRSISVEEKRRSQAISSSENKRDEKARTANIEEAERGEAGSVGEQSVGGAGGTLESDIKGVDEEAGPKDFYHPASVEPQPVIWLARDPLGLAKAEEAAIREKGILVSIENACMDEKGHVDISGRPPDEVEL
ncbi:hypothetical protein AcV5_002534 [Taiwanofungus camphoratus]|nr:hypothetical protein AcV5_002534 [Antrodia cinnamomea]